MDDNGDVQQRKLQSCEIKEFKKIEKILTSHNLVKSRFEQKLKLTNCRQIFGNSIIVFAVGLISIQSFLLLFIDSSYLGDMFTEFSNGKYFLNFIYSTAPGAITIVHMIFFYYDQRNKTTFLWYLDSIFDETSYLSKTKISSRSLKIFQRKCFWEFRSVVIILKGGLSGIGLICMFGVANRLYNFKGDYIGVGIAIIRTLTILYYARKTLSFLFLVLLKIRFLVFYFALRFKMLCDELEKECSSKVIKEFIVMHIISKYVYLANQIYKFDREINKLTLLIPLIMPFIYVVNYMSFISKDDGLEQVILLIRIISFSHSMIVIVFAASLAVINQQAHKILPILYSTAIKSTNRLSIKLNGLIKRLTDTNVAFTILDIVPFTMFQVLTVSLELMSYFLLVVQTIQEMKYK